MDGVLLAGRILTAILFVLSGINHFAQRQAMSQYTAHMGVPMAELAVLGSGAYIVAVGLLYALGVWPDLMALLLAAFLVPVALIMHRFWAISDPAMRATQMAHFLKNIALAGAALVAFAFFQQFGTEVGLTITDPLFGG
ncbi:MAG: DoxX family protein [Dehalococcoidia bacterium]|nr:DoxX family protein [Dehalococcoidia bacterium]